ncbi:MAG: hypothetical protein QOC59_18 [Microbacteriaceae bacterium]|nr:hypothetical protein [Microbacteriaceae bacterium]
MAVPSTQKPNRPLLVAGLVPLVVGAVLLLLHLGAWVDGAALVLTLVAVIVVLKAFGWQFTRRW